MKPKRITAFLLSVAMTISLLPTFTLTASAEETQTTTAKNITLGSATLHDGDTQNSKWDYVYFGTYSNSPIKWRVLSTKGNSTTTDGTIIDNATYKTKDNQTYTSNALFMLSENTLGDNIMFGGSNTYQGSKLQTTMQGILPSESDELNYVLQTTKTDSPYSFRYLIINNIYGTHSFGTCSLSSDTLYALSANEVNQYLGDNGLSEDDSYWWLRSPNSTGTYVGVVRDHKIDAHGTTQKYGVRPAFNLNSDSILFTSTADGKKTNNVGTLLANEKNTGNEYKLTMLDTSRKFKVTETSAQGTKGETITFNYDEAQTGTDEHISAMIVKNSEVLYYGQGEKTETSPKGDGTEKGKVKFTLPNDIENGEYTLYVFNEQINGDYKTDFSSTFQNVTLNVLPKVTFKDIGGTKQTYLADTAREISFTPLLDGGEVSGFTQDNFVVKYYEVDENSGLLKSTSAVNAVSAGKYLYVIDFADNDLKNDYYISRVFEVTNKTLPNIDDYDNIGFMYITSGAENAQKPIFFKEGTVNLKVGGTFKNTLTNENGTTATYESSNTAVATVDANGEVTAIGKGTATITATSIRENSTPVYASYTVNVGLATKTLTADNFDVVAKSKTYDETDSVTLTATLKNDIAYEGDNLKFDITGKFENANAGDNKKVSYEITGITGTGAENYVLDGGKISVSAENSTVKANIAKAQVTIICSETTTRTYDGNAQSVDVSAMANGKVFDKSNYDIKYNGGEAPSAVGSYPVTIELKAEAAKNYEVTQPSATLVIKSATQDVFSIELKGVSDVVYYGDSFTLSADGATGDVEYASSDSDILAISGTDAVAKSTGRVTITATSKKDGYVDKYATKTIEVKKRVLTPTVTATNKTYDGTNTVDASVSLDNTVNSDEIGTNTTTGTMANADAGNGKIVYVSGIELTGEKNEYYTLSTTSLQATVDIEKKEITGFTVSANDKKYDGTKNATATVETINGVIEADKGQVEIVGKAEFNSKDSGDRTVTFTATGLSGAKAQNYKFKDENAKTSTDTAKIEPLKVDFVIGQKTFVYDGNKKEISVSASDENGKIFKDCSVEYKKGGNSATPNEVGIYTATITLGDTTNYYTEQGDIDVVISEATQDSLVIVGLPGTIQYGDSFELEAVGGEDGGSYKWTSDNKNVKIQKSETDETDGSALANPYIKINGAVGKNVEISVTKTVSNYEPITAKVVFVPTAKTVTFDISNLEQTYGAVTDVTVNPNETGATYDVTYNGSNTLPTNAGTYTVKVTATGNYTGVQTATLTIKKDTAAGTITGVNDSYTYGTTVSANDVAVENLKNGTSAKITYAGTGIYVPQESAPTKVGNYTVIAEITGDNYETLTVTKDFEITKKELTVNAKNAEREYGDANPIFELEYSGFVPGEDKNVLLSEPIATVNANASSPVTDDKTKYYITVSGGNAENYKFKYDNTGELKINPTSNGTLYITGSSNTV